MFPYIMLYTHVHPDTEMFMTNETIEDTTKRNIEGATKVKLRN